MACSSARAARSAVLSTLRACLRTLPRQTAAHLRLGLELRLGLGQELRLGLG